MIAFFKWAAVIIGLSLCFSAYSEGCKATKRAQYFAANHPGFRYMGRVNMLDSKAVYNWPGVTVFSQFTGNKLGVHIKGGATNYFNVWVDDMPAHVVHAQVDTVWWFPEKLSNGTHQLRIVKRTEADMGQATFRGIYLGKNESLLEPPTLPERKMVFIGNSITCGYGTEGQDKSERFHASTENCEKSFSTIMARSFNAQYQLVSHSGLGMVRNYGDSLKRSVKIQAMPPRVDYLLDNDETTRYDMQKFIPDVIVINLGTNDYSTQPHPDESDFINAGKQLINRLLNLYPGVRIFCMAGPMICEAGHVVTRKMVQLYQQQNPDQAVFFLGLPYYFLNTEDDLGSDWHPSYKGQLKSAFHLIPFISEITGWDYSQQEALLIHE